MAASTPTRTTLSQSSLDSSMSSLPSKRRRVNLGGAEAVVDDLEEDVDEEDLRNRRIQHIVDSARVVGSPTQSPAGESNRRKTGKNGMSNNQIIEHYTSCLKLSAENKINAKNAFNLHLIDYMSDVLNHDQVTNFQIAGTMLDASSKIYAYRIDSVHREALKIAGGLGRADTEGRGDNEDDEGNPNEQGDDARPTAKVLKKKKKKVTKGHTIETNERNLNMVINESQFAGDALFDKVRSNFDEGVSSGLFLNTLSTANDSNRLLLHCLVDSRPGRLATTAGNTVAAVIDELNELLSSADLSEETLCGGLSDFKFLGWKPDTTVERDRNKTGRGKNAATQDNDTEAPGRFVVELPPTPPPRIDFGGAEDDDYDGGAGGFDDSGERPPSATNEQPADQQNGPSTLDAIVAAVSALPLEYTYFDQTLLSSVGGASHWRVQAKLASLKREHDNDGASAEPQTKGRKVATGPKKQVGRKRKGPVQVAFDQELDVNALVPMGSRGTEYSNAKLAEWQETGIGAGEVNGSDRAVSDRVRSLFSKPDLWMRGGRSSPELIAGDHLDDNTQGEPPQGQPIDAAADGQDDDAQPEVPDLFDDEEDGNDEIDFEVGGADDYDEDDVIALGDDIKADLIISDGTNDAAGVAGAFINGLLQQPYKVTKIVVPYDQQAKKIDVKIMKRGLWGLLTPSDADESQPSTSRALFGSPRGKRIVGSKKLSELCAELPDVVPEWMADNISTPVAFVCLLHMCNEKNLALEECTDDMSDLLIKMGNSERGSDPDDEEEEDADQEDDEEDDSD